MHTKCLPLSIVPLLFFALALRGQPVQKTLVRAFDIGVAQEVVLDMGGPVTVQHWSNGIVRVQMQVVLDNAHQNMLQSLISSGRYNLKGETQGSVFTITAPGLRKTVRVGDAPLSERVAFTVFVPENATITVSGGKPVEDLADGVPGANKPM